MTKHYINRFTHILAALLLAAVATSCLWEPTYPADLVQADSLMIQGHYGQADSLLARYDSTRASRRTAFRAYRQLLSLQRRFVDGSLSEAHFSLADSLARYYNKSYTREKHAKALLFLGDVYRGSGDYPSALDCYLKAEAEELPLGDLTIDIWVNQVLGDVYFEQRMLPECIGYYRKQYALSVQKRDTLRMAYGASSMTIVCMVNNDIDSIFFYLNKTIEWGEKVPQDTEIVPLAKAHLADIYIQTEQFDKAAAIMPHDSRNEYNWAYWHLGQHHTDSALLYFSKMSDKDDWSAKVEYLPILAHLAEEKNDVSTAKTYYEMLAEAKDSMQFYSQVEKTRLQEALYKYNVLKTERDDAEQRSFIMKIAFSFIIALSVLLSLFLARRWRDYKQQKEKEVEQERLLRAEEEHKYKRSESVIEENRKKIALLEQELTDAKKKNNTASVQLLSAEAKKLETDNKEISTILKRNNIMPNCFLKSDLYLRIKKNAGKEDFHLSEEEWQQLASSIDEAYDQFTSRLLTLCNELSEHELRICYLIKLNVSSTAIGVMLYRSKAAIGMARQRLYVKLTGKKGTAQQLNNLIENF